MRFLIFVLALALCACPQQGPVPPTPDAADSSVDAGQDVATDTASPVTVDAAPAAPSCATWCAHAKALNCVAAAPTPAGSACTDVCANTLTGPAPLNVQCRTIAPTCAAADECEIPLLIKKKAAPAKGAGLPVDAGGSQLGTSVLGR